MPQAITAALPFGSSLSESEVAAQADKPRRHSSIDLAGQIKGFLQFPGHAVLLN